VGEGQSGQGGGDAGGLKERREEEEVEGGVWVVVV
jgi:hypothetical protein